ncbi:MAG: hypothetical protein Q7S40_32075 [Opitutaceae bacterium]|nr:hypothetical protein [Opitutaceae bacterium]
MTSPRREQESTRIRGAESNRAGATATRADIRIHPVWWSVAALVTVALAVTFMLPKGFTLGAPHTDLTGQFVAWRAFAAESMRAGDFPFWNPYVYSGQPFLGGFQSALLYPLNVAFLILPLERALTFSVLLHLGILAAGIAFWARRRGTHPVAAAVTGFCVALSGVVFPHVYAGHLSNVCTMAWAPWAFAGLESWWRDRRPEDGLLATAAIAMQILAGQVQYVFFFGIAAGIHALVASGFEPATRRRALPAVAIAGGIAALLTAAQLLPGIEAAAEGIRQGKMDIRFSGSFALPPENLFTAIAPGFFGDADIGAHPYWGRCYLWEMSCYFGVGMLICAVVACWDNEYRRRARADWLVAAILIVLALGRHLPVYAFLHQYVPGFGQFRGMSKFTFPAVLFLAMAASGGLDGLIRQRWNGGRIGVISLAVAGLFAALAALFWAQPAIVRGIFAWLLARAPEELLIALPVFPAGAGAHAAASVIRAAIILLAFGGVLLAGRSRPRWRWAVVALLPLDLIQFVVPHLATTSVAAAMPVELRQFVGPNPTQDRALNLLRPNNGYLLGAADLWGNDPGVLKRYAEFMTFTQGGDPNFATQNLQFRIVHRLYAMLRCPIAFVPSDTGAKVVNVPNPLPRALLVAGHRVIASRDAIFAAMVDESFDPRHTVVLERAPSPVPIASAAAGTVRVTASDTDSMTIEAEVTTPAILLITDLYSSGWRALALPGSAQQTYELMPANYILRAVPLRTGHHRLRMEYRPRMFMAGALISALAWMGWLGGVLVWRRRTTRD